MTINDDIGQWIQFLDGLAESSMLEVHEANMIDDIKAHLVDVLDRDDYEEESPRQRVSRFLVDGLDQMGQP